MGVTLFKASTSVEVGPKLVSTHFEWWMLDQPNSGIRITDAVVV